MPPNTRFDAAYFKRFYRDRATQVVSRQEMRARAELIAAILRQAQHPIHSILDAGCGLGLMQSTFKRVLPRARYTGLEASDYLCKRYGWTAGSVADFKPRQPYDLVICYDVLQYLDERAAARAMSNLGRLARVGLYFSALTREDWRDNCDRSLTDSAVNMRTAAWYRGRLMKSFNYLGFGVWVKKTRSTVRWAFEA